MQGHREFQIVTPRTLDKFSGKTLVLPHVRLLDSQEKAALNRYADSGVRIITVGDDQTGITARENVIRRKAFPASSDQTRLPEIDREFMADIRGGEFARVEAAASIATSVTRVNGQLHVFLANFTGLVGGSNPVQTPQSGVKITLRRQSGSGQSDKGHFLPFLGKAAAITGVRQNGDTVFTLPAIEKGGVFWCEERG